MVKPVKLFSLFAILFAALASPVAAQYVYTANGRLIRTQEAIMPKGGTLSALSFNDVNIVTSSYGNLQGTLVSHSIIRNSLHLDYAITNKLQFAVNALVYQDIHHQTADAQGAVRPEPKNLFDNITLAAKFAGFSFGNDKFYAGALASFMIPTAGEGRYNSFGNPYSAGGTEFGFNVLLSYYADNLFPRESFNVNANFGIYNYLDNGKNITNRVGTSLLAGSNSNSLNYSLGFKYPTSSIDLMLEFWGWSFLTQPDRAANTRDDMTFATFGVKIKPVDYIGILLGFDYQLSGRTGTTDLTNFRNFSIIERPSNDPTNYTRWRFILGIQANILPIAGTTTTDPRAIDFSSESQGSDVIIRKLEDIGGDKDATSKKILEIQRRRQDIDKNLQQLRQILKVNETSSSAVPVPIAPPTAVAVTPVAPTAPAPKDISTISEGDKIALNIHFATGKSVVPSEDFSQLDEVAAKLSAKPRNIEVSGHTDNQGKVASNKSLSLRRAQAIKAYLTKKGISSGSISVRGAGPDEPIGDNTTEDGRALNRRIEMKVVK
jgi:outer membrane protein OmpA-like peptidoglycan-associated protein